ncbi:MAG: type II toxin-antitoxin system VapC family toxin [Cyanobacteria bacterium J06623_5]
MSNSKAVGEEPKHLLLDTHVWLWLLAGETEKLSKTCLVEVLAASRLSVSAISIWEIGMLESKGRIQLRKNCLEWVREALSAPKMSLQPLTPEIAVESSRLPGSLHGDPADRILAATSRLVNAYLVTKDRKLWLYGEQSFISVIKA